MVNICPSFFLVPLVQPGVLRIRIGTAGQRVEPLIFALLVRYVHLMAGDIDDFHDFGVFGDQFLNRFRRALELHIAPNHRVGFARHAVGGRQAQPRVALSCKKLLVNVDGGVGLVNGYLRSLFPGRVILAPPQDKGFGGNLTVNGLAVGSINIRKLNVDYILRLRIVDGHNFIIVRGQTHIVRPRSIAVLYARKKRIVIEVKTIAVLQVIAVDRHHKVNRGARYVLTVLQGRDAVLFAIERPHAFVACVDCAGIVEFVIHPVNLRLRSTIVYIQFVVAPLVALMLICGDVVNVYAVVILQILAHLTLVLRILALGAGIANNHTPAKIVEIAVLFLARPQYSGFPQTALRVIGHSRIRITRRNGNDFAVVAGLFIDQDAEGLIIVHGIGVNMVLYIIIILEIVVCTGINQFIDPFAYIGSIDTRIQSIADGIRLVGRRLALRFALAGAYRLQFALRAVDGVIGIDGIAQCRRHVVAAGNVLPVGKDKLPVSGIVGIVLIDRVVESIRAADFWRHRQTAFNLGAVLRLWHRFMISVGKQLIGHAHRQLTSGIILIGADAQRGLLRNFRVAVGHVFIMDFFSQVGGIPRQPHVIIPVDDIIIRHLQLGFASFGDGVGILRFVGGFVQRQVVLFHLVFQRLPFRVAVGRIPFDMPIFTLRHGIGGRAEKLLPRLSVIRRGVERQQHIVGAQIALDLTAVRLPFHIRSDLLRTQLHPNHRINFRGRIII